MQFSMKDSFLARPLEFPARRDHDHKLHLHVYRQVVSSHSSSKMENFLIHLLFSKFISTSDDGHMRAFCCGNAVTGEHDKTYITCKGECNPDQTFPRNWRCGCVQTSRKKPIVSNKEEASGTISSSNQLLEKAYSCQRWNQLLPTCFGRLCDIFKWCTLESQQQRCEHFYYVHNSAAFEQLQRCEHF